MSETEKEEGMEREPQRAEIILYQSEGANVPIEVYYRDETLWAPQKAIAELFGVSMSTISEHLRNIFNEGELQKPSVTSFSGFSEKTSSRGGRPTTFYSLDAILSVGYRVNSPQATRFRQWATATLGEYVTKGFVLNDDMLKNGRPFGQDYFDELLARIRDIRASERRVWLKVTDLVDAYGRCTPERRAALVQSARDAALASGEAPQRGGVRDAGVA